MPNCDMRKPIDIMFLKWSKREIALSPSKLKLNPFPSKQEMVHFAMSLYLQPPQPLCHLGVPLQLSDSTVPQMVYHFGFVP